MKERQMQLSTPRLTLMPFSEKDMDRVIAILCNEEVGKTYMVPAFDSREQAERMFARLRELSLAKDHFVYGIYLENRLIGFLNDVEMTADTVELGYVIHPDEQNRGYATEALGAAIAELFRMGFSRVRAGYFAENPASGRVMEKCGMKRIPETGEIEYRGAVHRCVYCEIPADEGKLTHIYFVRHGEPNYDNHDDLTRELTGKGLRDRELVTAFLAEKNIDAVLSSPYKRAVDTVGHFASTCGFSVTTIPDFRERRVDSGWIEDFAAFSQKQWSDFSYKRNDGESLGEVQERSIAALRTVLRAYRGQSVVIGSHGTALSTVIHYYQPAFGFSEFQRIRGLMPWIVHFVFAEEKCLEIREYNPFSGEERKILPL